MNKLIRWLTNFFRGVKEPPFNLHHPDIAANVEFAFECLDKKYYRMAQEFRMPTGRFKFVDAYMAEHEMRMKLETLKAYLDKIEAVLNGKQGVIKLSDIAVTVHNMRTRANLGFDVETVERLASVVYFDESEDLRDYDPEYGKKKVKEWMSDGKYSFFLTRPIDELLNIRGISIEYLQTYIQAQRELINELTYEAPTPSAPNSSEDGTSK